ncbi:hypothetical protein VFPPC_03765 [Pochonia chlamydosporia 170]|uniref:Rhodopsin domain-containing protein n=1 Tax=Pochonia chlamydosporia 170 TaxID=1380566 RepID=A0A179F2C0_METCM|nr:hypothetical protein VFPPC_03765 [Pochonia chlamydosporia 170]OAQ59531.1 hypothetical protein VFPPC_03765 [Pochonia chlamydosporia 170]
MGALPEPPPGLDLNETKVPSLVSAFVVTWVLGLAIVGLRITARRLSRNELWWDDWLIIVSLVFSGGFMFDVTCYMAARGGFGKHVWAAPHYGLKAYFLGLFAAEYLYTMSIVLVKWSVLAFYWRIFSAASITRWCIWISTAIVSAWGIAVIDQQLQVLVSTFQCWPVSAFWRRFDPHENLSSSAYKCTVDVRLFFIANAIPNIITDLLILLIPLPGICRLQLRRPQKLALLGVFAIGLFITAVSSIRLYYVVALDFSSIDVTWLFSEEMMWTGIEVNVATICACLPSLKPILSLAVYGTAQHSSERNTSGSYPVIVTFGGTGEPRKLDERLKLNPSNNGISTVYVTSEAQQHEDTHPLSALTDNDSVSLTECGSRDVEMDRIDDIGERRWARANYTSQTPNQVMVTKTVGVHVGYTQE